MDNPSSSSSRDPQTPLPPSDSEHQYDVFLSFRKEDTGYGFTDHLYHALDQKELRVFRDSEKPQMAEPELVKAIKTSKFAVMVLSPNYATSRRCLDELVHILRCKDVNKSEVFPVLYQVGSWEVSRQIRLACPPSIAQGKGSFMHDFIKLVKTTRHLIRPVVTRLLDDISHPFEERYMKPEKLTGIRSIDNVGYSSGKRKRHMKPDKLTEIRFIDDISEPSGEWHRKPDKLAETRFMKPDELSKIRFMDDISDSSGKDHMKPDKLANTRFVDDISDSPGEWQMKHDKLAKTQFMDNIIVPTRDWHMKRNKLKKPQFMDNIIVPTRDWHRDWHMKRDKLKKPQFMDNIIVPTRDWHMKRDKLPETRFIYDIRGSLGELHMKRDKLGETRFIYDIRGLLGELHMKRDKLSETRFMSDLLEERRESEVVQDIVNQISRLNHPYIPKEELVGMDVRVQEILDHLDLTSNEVLTLGIWGMGGIGKTTLANEVSKRISWQFYRSGFVSEVRSKSAIELQKCLGGFFLGKQRTEEIDTVEKGIRLLKKALSRRKVLIILDDVDSFKQIECLAPGGPLGEQIWGRGSRLIITTRDRRLLRHLNVKVLIEVKILSDEEASQLLCQKAFKNDSPPENFVELSKSLLRYAGGLPLAHEVLGSGLSNREVEHSSHILHKLDDEEYKKIFSVLQTSFDGLQDTDKNIFLDIACFFNGEDYVRVKNILKACGFASGIGINNLIDKSLLKVEKNKLRMHGLLQSLGWHIVRNESPSPGKRSRLWVNDSAHKHKDSGRSDDVREVLIDNTGTAAVESLLLSLPEKEQMSLTADPFVNMRKLRLLKIYNVNFLVVKFGHFSRNLRLLEWHECPLQSFPKNFMSVKLVEIRMPNSSIEHLWNAKLSLGMLTLMDLSDCRYLATTPDFTTVPNLETLIVQGCTRLSELHNTIWNHEKLKFLNLKGCTSLQCLPQCISMTSLEIFILSGCSKLQKFPESWEKMDTLSELHLDGTAFREVPSSIQLLKGLILLNLNDCKDLRGLPSILCGSLTSLKFLYLPRCLSLETLPDNIDCLEHLEELDACNTALRELPQSISLLKNLKLLSFRGCSGLQLPSKLSGLSSLTTLNLGGCNLPEGAIPDDIGDLKSLKSLDLSENNFLTISESICHLSALTEISLFRCTKLRSLPKDIPSSLRYINLNGCSVLTNFSSSWARYSRPEGLNAPKYSNPEDDESCKDLGSSEEKLMAIARHIAKTLGHKDNMADDILQIFSNFDERSVALELTLKSLEQ